MKERRLAVRYARALLSALTDPAKVDAADTFLHEVAASIESSAELRDVLMNPSISRPMRNRVLASLADGQGMPAEVKSFLILLVDNGRIAALAAIAEVFREEKEIARGIVSATVTTATPLTPELKDRTAATLEKLSGKRINLKLEVDPTLIGGMVTQVGSMVYDGSVKTHLARLRRRMSEE